MEFDQKLQQLRKMRNLTQEKLAEQLFVSRTAISKWESGRGYPSIDSLKIVAEFFHVTVDELISGSEIVKIAQTDMEDRIKRHASLLCGILDCLTILLLFLPFFGQVKGDVIAVAPLYSLTGISLGMKVAFLVFVIATTLNGFVAIVIFSFDKPSWQKHRLYTGIGLSIIGTLLFILSRHPYAGSFAFFILVAKGLLLTKSK